MHKIYLSLLLILFSVSFSNCASSTVGIASSNRPIPGTPYETIKTVDRLFTWYSVDFIIISGTTSTPPTEKIYGEMMEGESADAIVNIRYYNEKAVFGPLIRHRFGIKGDLVRFTQTPATTTTKGKSR